MSGGAWDEGIHVHESYTCTREINFSASEAYETTQEKGKKKRKDKKEGREKMLYKVYFKNIIKM